MVKQLSDDDRAYHQRLAGQVQWAQQNQQKITGIFAAWELWGEYLKDKYGFGDGDVLDHAGNILDQAGNPPTVSDAP